jgi:hypothetical protein
MGIKVKGNFNKVIFNLEAKQNMNNFLEETAGLINSSIQIRVQKFGIGLDNNKMKKYSKEYAEYRIKTGRQANYRSLTFFGLMFQSLTYKTIAKNMVKLFFFSEFSNIKAYWNHKRTPFFGISKREQKVISQQVKKYINT